MTVGQAFCGRRLTANPVRRLTSSATPECQRDVPLLRVKAGAILSIGIADKPASTKPSSSVTAVAMPASRAGATTRQKKTPTITSTKADWFASQLKNSGDRFIWDVPSYVRSGLAGRLRREFP